MGQGTGRAADLLVSQGVISGFCHQKKHVLFCNGNKNYAPHYLYTASALTPALLGKGGEGEGQWWDRGMMCS